MLRLTHIYGYVGEYGVYNNRQKRERERQQTKEEKKMKKERKTCTYNINTYGTLDVHCTHM